jgi:hypothetical protein
LEISLSSPGREYYLIPLIGFPRDADLFAWTTGGVGSEVSRPHTVRFRLTLIARGTNVAETKTYECCYEPPFLLIDGVRVKDVGE